MRITIIKAAVLLTALLQMHAGFAHIPGTLNYQGYLSDAADSPINGSVEVSFSLYNVENGGTPLWADTRDVVVTRGLLCVQLGGPTNAVPVDLFDNTLWLGITAGTDLIARQTVDLVFIRMFRSLEKCPIFTH